MESYKQKVYSILKSRILRCQLMPNEVIDQNEIIKELNVSRTPVRDAIAALEQEGLVVVLPRRGVLVSSLSLETIQNIYSVREVLEPRFAALAVHTADSERLRSYLDIFEHASDISTFTQADLDFHKYLAELTHNRYWIQLMDTVLSHNMRFVVLGANIPQRVQNSNREHAALIYAILEKDPVKAEELMRKHIQQAHKSCLESTTTISY